MHFFDFFEEKFAKDNLFIVPLHRLSKFSKTSVRL